MAPPVVQLAVSYGAGLWAGLVFLFPRSAIACLALAAVLAVLRARWGGVLAAAAVVGVAAGGVQARRAAAACGAVWAVGRQAAIVAIEDAPGSRGTAAATVRHHATGCRGRLRLRSAHDLPAGGLVAVVGPHRGGGVLRVEHARVLAAPRSGRFVIRDAVARRIGTLYGARAGLVEALVLGRRDELDPGLRHDFVAAGLAHLLAISGLHVGIIAAWLALGFRLVGLRRAAWLLSAAAAWGYVALLGFPPPATRAAGFLTVFGLARLRQRHPPASAVLAVAVLVVLAVDPAAATSVGAWLSVAAVWGTTRAAVLVPRGRPLARLAAASAGATLMTAPITAFVFGSVAPAGLAANIVAVPLAGVAVPGVLLSLALGGPVAAGAGLALGLIERVAAAAAWLPGGHLVGPPGPAFAAPFGAALALLVWLSRRRRLPVARRLAVALGGALVVHAVLSWRGLPARGSGFAMYVLDVGQGDAIAIRTPRDRWLLVDAGPRGPRGDAGRGVVVPFLRRRGVPSLQAWILTHGDADHLGGGPAVVAAMVPPLVLEPGQPRGTALYLEHLAAVDASGALWRPARVGDMLEIDDVRVSVLHPASEWMAGRFAPNENSVVLRVTYGCFDALLAGDAGFAAESVLTPRVREVDLLKVGHHGSAGATSDAWLDGLRPRAAVISVGPNTYGHPAPDVLRRLAVRGVPVFRTDRGGTVTVRSDGRYFQVIQGGPSILWERVLCRLRRSSRSNASSWSRNGCIPVPPATLPACSTISPSPRR